MSAINWALFTETPVGRGHPTLPDVLNRPLRAVLTASGYDPDDDFGNGFAKTNHTHVAADITNLAGVLATIAAVGTLTVGVWNATPITDTYLATIVTAGKVANSATSATALNTASTIVARDGSGNFAAGTITASLTGNVTGAVTGNASTATALSSARSFTITGDVAGTVSATLAAGVSIPVTLSAGVVTNAHIAAGAAIADTKLATIATSGKVANSATTATSANTPSTIVARDASGNFALATITGGVWQGSSIATAYTDAKLKTATGTTSRLVVGGTATDPTFNVDPAYDILIRSGRSVTLSTVTNPDGSITEIFLGGVTCVTTFPTATTIVATYSGAFAQIITTTFNADGSTTETVT